MAKNRLATTRYRGIGAGYLLKLTIGICLLMAINGYLVGLLVQVNLPNIPSLFHDVRLFQFCQIIFSFLLVTIQFVIYDRIRDRMASADRTSSVSNPDQSTPAVSDPEAGSVS